MSADRTKSLSNPLAALVSRAADRLPRTTGATQAAQARIDAPRVSMILADVSASMAEPAGARRKIDVLRQALSGAPGRIVAFSWDVWPVASAADLPHPSGGTALHLALDRARQEGASDVLVISDGHPDDAAAALRIADKMQARIDVVYCGPEHDREGMAFMRRLARGGGRAHHAPPSRPAQIAEAVRLALPAPGRRT